VSQASYASSQGYLRSSKGYSARGMSVSKMDGDLEREIVSSGLGAEFAMSNAAQCSTANSFSAEADDQKGSNDLASIVGSMVIPGTLPPSVPGSAGAAKAEKKKESKKGVSKSKSSRW
jgi:hypothetical protein